MPDALAGTRHLPMTDLAKVREDYRAGKTALFEFLGASGSSTRGIHSLLQKLAKHTDATLKILWQVADFPPAACLVADSVLT